MDLVLVRWGEIALKGQNRPMFLRRLRRNIRAALAASGLESTVVTSGQRILVSTPDAEAALEPLSRVFGIVSASPVAPVERDLKAITHEALVQAERAGLGIGGTFRITARRTDKRFPLPSTEIERSVGAAVSATLGAGVDLSRAAQVTIGIEITSDSAWVYSTTIRGPAGLPVGVAGRVVSLLSGGLDSFVAAWLMIRRGCSVIPLHIAMDPQHTRSVTDQLAVLQSYSHSWHLRPVIVDYARAVLPFTARLLSPRDLRWTCLVCKRAMMECAVATARDLDAHAIVMGDSLGQVASQTLVNLEAVSAGIELPILRPLIGMDKDEILSLARRIGLDEQSAHSAPPCPHVPDHPVTRATAASFASLWADCCAIEELV